MHFFLKYYAEAFSNSLKPVFILIVIFSSAVVIGEIANFAAYAFAPAILVTPLGALSIIIRQEDKLSLLLLLLLLMHFRIQCVLTILWHVRAVLLLLILY